MRRADLWGTVKRTAGGPPIFCRRKTSDIELRGKLGTLLYEAEPLLRLVSHQALYRTLRLHGIANRHFEERSLLGIHRRFAELARHHLAKALEPADLDLAIAFEHRPEQLFAM